MAKVVTSFDFDVGIVTIEVPQGDLLVAIGAALGRWGDEARRLAADMARLRGDGVFLDEDGEPVVPGWWERKDKGRHVAWYLVWSHEYARQAGRKRREYVRAGDYEATKVKVERTLEYANLKARHDKVTAQIERAGQELRKLVERFDGDQSGQPGGRVSHQW
jgi:hypothetical protein